MSDKDGAMIDFVSWLRDAMNKRGMMQQELADRINADYGHISRILSGKITPSGTTMQKILDCFDSRIAVVPKGAVVTIITDPIAQIYELALVEMIKRRMNDDDGDGQDAAGDAAEG